MPTLRENLQGKALRLALAAATLAAVGMLGQTQVASLANALSVGIALLSLNVLLGYTGQISLGQAAFVGCGGFLAVNLGGRGLPVIPVVIAAGLGVALITAIVGLPSLRIKGLAVAIATLVFGIAAQNWLFQQGWFIGADAGLVLLAPFGRGPTFRLFLLVVGFLTLVVLLDKQLLRSKLGRAFITVRDGEERAVAFGVTPGPAKLRAYALSGFMAGIAGALIAYQSGTVSAGEFGVFTSLQFLAIAVVGGTGSRGGVLAAALLLVGYPSLFPPPDATIAPLLGGILLIVVVMFLPSGLGGLGVKISSRWQRLPGAVRAAIVIVGGLALAAQMLREQGFRDVDSSVGDGGAAAWPLAVALITIGIAVVLLAVRNLTANSVALAAPAEGAIRAGGETAAKAARAAANAVVVRQVPRAMGLRMPSRVMFEATNVGVRFGGVQALDSIGLEIREGEIVGLIGANGAGKSTFYNVVSGFVTPTPGSSLLYKGRELLDVAPAMRTTWGIARTFQHMGLIRDQTVEDNVLLAQHWLADYDDWLGTMRAGGSARTEKELRHRARLALEIFGLEDHLHDRLGSLSYGTMRMVELASAVAGGSDLLFFDEASAGLGPDEAHGLADRFHALRDELGLTLVIIEHHVPLIARTCDYVYCLASGRQLAEGVPASVQDNPEVIAEFLGRSTIEKARA